MGSVHKPRRKNKQKVGAVWLSYLMAFEINCYLNNTRDAFFCFLPPFSSNPVPSALTSSIVFSSYSLSTRRSIIHRVKLRRPSSPSLTRASNDERNPSGLIEEDSKFVPLNSDEPVYGPPALLLLGFEVAEVAKIQQLLKQLDGEFLQVILCTEAMILRPLWEVIHMSQPNFEAVEVVQSLPRICFLSGLSGEEMMMFIDAFPEAGLEPAVFAALVPNSANKPLQELIEEIMGDHEMLTGKQEGSTSNMD